MVLKQILYSVSRSFGPYGFNNYGKYGLLCGADGIPHLMVNGDQRHWGEFITPGLLFLYIAGWIGLVGRRSYLIAISVSSQETSDERDHH
ncbi:hypothetical protein YC2023_018965 [Brassica napus]